MSGDLDEFFAKKDKSRKKKIKGITNDEFVKKYEARCKEDADNRERASKQMFMNLEGFIQDDGDEWNDFEDENKDYSGLKIQPLIIDDKEQIETEEEIAAKKEAFEWGQKGPQDSELSETSVAPNTEAPDANAAAPSDESGKAGGTEEALDPTDLTKYSFKELFLKRKELKAAKLGPKGPRIDDIAEFPDLGATQEAIEDAKTYQMVQPSGSNRPPPKPLPGQRASSYNDVTTDNKYSALRNNF